MSVRRASSNRASRNAAALEPHGWKRMMERVAAAVSIPDTHHLPCRVSPLEHGEFPNFRIRRLEASPDARIQEIPFTDSAPLTTGVLRVSPPARLRATSHAEENRFECASPHLNCCALTRPHRA